jgi:hypothetical protein
MASRLEMDHLPPGAGRRTEREERGGVGVKGEGAGRASARARLVVAKAPSFLSASYRPLLTIVHQAVEGVAPGQGAYPQLGQAVCLVGCVRVPR